MVITKQIIKDWYNYYRTAYFKNEIPESQRIRFEITHNRRQLGCFHWESIGSGYLRVIKISDYYVGDEDHYRNVLLHEMCHLWCFDNGHPHEHHGRIWQRKAFEISNLSGYNISRCTSVANLKIDDRFAARQQKVVDKKFGKYLIVIEDFGDHKFLIKTTKNVYLRHLNEYDNSISGVFKPFRVFLSDGFPNKSCSRSFTRGYRIENDIYEKKVLPVLESGEELDRASDVYYQHIFDVAV